MSLFVNKIYNTVWLIISDTPQSLSKNGANDSFQVKNNRKVIEKKIEILQLEIIIWPLIIDICCLEDSFEKSVGQCSANKLLR